MSDSGEEVKEEFVPEEEAEMGPALVKRLRERLASAEKEKQENLEGWQRARADLANFKRDEEVQRSHNSERLKASMAEEIIPVLDGFEMAFKSPSYSKADAEWRKGMEGLYAQLVSALKMFNVIQEKPPEGEMFDPARHEALREVPVDTKEKDHTVVSVERSGYSIGNHLIRPAQVSIGTHKI